MNSKKPKANRWCLHSGLIEIYWKKNPRGLLFADKVRVGGVTFWYISDKKLWEKAIK